MLIIIYIFPFLFIVQALSNSTDLSIFTQLLRGQETNVFFKDAVVNMLRTLQNEQLFNQDDILKYIGKELF